MYEGLKMTFGLTALRLSPLFDLPPTPLVFLTDAAGRQSVHIAPEAFDVATAEFKDEVAVWQNALPGALKGKLASVSASCFVPTVPH